MVEYGLKELGDNEFPNHMGIFTIPVRVAVNYKIPLIIWGENPDFEYGGSARNLKQFSLKWLQTQGGMLGKKLDDIGIPIEDMKPYIYPSKEELKISNITGLYLGYYFKWDTHKQLKLIQEKCNWKTNNKPIEGTYGNWEDLDCYSMTVHEYLKYVKFGFGRATDHACCAIRNGIMDRKKAVELVNEYGGKYPKEAMNRFLDYLGLPKEVFFDIIQPFVNKDIFVWVAGKPIRDKNDNFILKERYMLK